MTFRIVFFFAALCLAAPDAAQAYSLRGTHPHDTPGRIVRGGSATRNSGTWGYRRIAAYEVSEHRTTGMYLHPYYRQPLVETGEYRFGRLTEYSRRHPYAYYRTQMPYRRLGY